MTLIQLRYLVAIADSGLNITQAAQRVHATQPGLSKQIKQIEAELGFLLFVRKGRSLKAMTAAGRYVLERARRILEETASIRAYAANVRGDTRGRLVIVTTHTQARHVLPAVLTDLNRTYPQLSVQLIPAADGDVLGPLEDGHADLAVISTSGEVPGPGLAVPLYGWKRVVVVRSDHPLAKRRRAPDLADLAAQPLLSYESSRRPDSSFQRAFAHAGLTPRLAMTARDADLIKTYVRENLGVGLLAEMAVSARLDPDLVILPAPPSLPVCTAWAVLPRTRVPRNYVLALLQRLLPRVDRRDLQRALEGELPAAWPEPPSWQDFSTSGASSSAA